MQLILKLDNQMETVDDMACLALFWIGLFLDLKWSKNATDPSKSTLLYIELFFHVLVGLLPAAQADELWFDLNII